MSMPCEVAVKSVVPAIRAGLAKELIQTYELKQNDVANLLGVTQTAVSKYTRNVRGGVVAINKTEEIQQMITATAKTLTNGELSRRQLAIRFCEICRLVREKGLMCELCKRSNPTIDISQCLLCMNHSDSSKCLSDI
ncbi:MAG: transcriptional regulator [Candidatus Bathyarchaeota archaeon]|jgi:predicted transcriptional regulator|nr:transcriptional regulator [Candidatus Bathyarchaeota archaeon]